MSDSPPIVLGVEPIGAKRIADKSEPRGIELVGVLGCSGRMVQIRWDTAACYVAMREAAWADGVPRERLGLHSGYRSVAQQETLFADALRKYGSEAAARKWVAKPGSSPHHSGRALDLDIDGSGCRSARAATQRIAPAHLWLERHAERYGFRPYLAEPWHWELVLPEGTSWRVTPAGLVEVA